MPAKLCTTWMQLKLLPGNNAATNDATTYDATTYDATAYDATNDATDANATDEWLFVLL